MSQVPAAGGGAPARVAGGAGSAPGRGVALEVAVWRVIAGYRVVAVAWLATLAVLTVAADRAPVAVAAPVVIVAVAWTAVAVAAAARADWRTRWAFVVVDVAVAVAVVLVPVLASPETGGYAGGFPFGAVLHAAVARGLGGGLAAGGVLAAATTGQQIAGPGDLLSQPVVEIGLFHVASAAVVAWAYRELQDRERDRAAAEEALAGERAERARSNERAETAAALHDSVLQTLALIQRRTDDPEVRRLARAQERGLRDWLHGDRDSPGEAGPPETPAPESAAAASRTHRVERDTVAAALRDRAAVVEADTDVIVDVVAVGDAAMDDARRALVDAAGEAMRNAACHAGVDRVAVYGEFDQARGFVAVRDRGCGFDPAAVPADRRGVRESIVGRLRRHGGVAEVDTAPGRGTEITLSMPAGEAEGAQ